jgi:uncharacterized membrane protein YkvI
MSEDKKVSGLNVVKFAGAFVAFIIGAGFASGQEIMQFFTSFGLSGIAGAVVSLVIFACLGFIIMDRGFTVRASIDAETKHPFVYWTTYKETGPLAIIGKGVSFVFEWLVLVFLFSIVVIMISGAGATMKQYFGLDAQIGCLIMSVLVFVSVFFGLKRLIDIIGMLGPIIIAFTIAVAIAALVSHPSGLADHAAGVAVMRESAPVGSWFLAAVLYVAYNISCSVAFLGSMGATANSRREARLGGIFGGVMLMGAALFVVLGQLSFASEVAGTDIPTLVLAQKIAPVLGAIFSIILLDEILSTAAPMMWLVCDRFTKENSKQQRILLVVLSVAAYFGGNLPFGRLVGTIYPYMGYMGLILIACIVIRKILDARQK